MNYEDDMWIDESALDLECKDQPELMMKYTKIQAELQKDEDEKKEALDLLKAKLDKKIRYHPDVYNIDKITEGAISSTILRDHEYQAANQTYIDARFENNVAKGAVRSCDQRKSMIETLVKLHGQQYFAGPKVPRDIVKEAEKRKKQKVTEGNIANTLRRTK